MAMIKIPPLPFSGGKQPQRVEDWSEYAAQLYPPQPPAPVAKRPKVLVTAFEKDIKIDVEGQPTIHVTLAESHDVANKVYDLVQTMEIL